MRDAIERLRRRGTSGVPERDAGWTLIEMIVVMSIFGGLMAIVFGVMLTVTVQSKDNLARTRTLDQARIGLMQIDRQVRSGNVISDPASETLAGSGVPQYYSLRVYTQTDGVYQCVQWRVRYPTGSAFGNLEYRSWKPNWQAVGGVSVWTTVARNVVKPAAATIVDSDPGTWPPFFVQQSDAEASSQAQTIRVTLRLKDPEQSAKSKPATLSSVLTGRNTVYGYPADSCSPVPNP